MKETISTLLNQKGTDVHRIEHNASVQEAVREMDRLKVGSIVVTEGSKLAGIFTEREALRQVIAPGRDPKTTPVSEVMSHAHQGRTIDADASLEQAMMVMSEKRYRYLVVMEDDRIRGLISNGDLTRWIAQENQNEAEYLRKYISGAYPG